MSYQDYAKEIYELLGTDSNIRTVNHCVTRLRIVLKDESIVDDKAIKNVKGVVGVMKQAGQYQIIIGNEVASYYKELMKLGNYDNNKHDTATEKKGVFATIIDVISSSMSPLIPAILGGGMIKVFLAVLPLMNIMNTDSSTYAVLSFFGDAPFYFIPIMIAYTTAQRFKVTPMLAVSVAGIMLHPDFISMANSGNPFNIFGLPITPASYASSVIPIIVMVWLMSYIEKGFDVVIPNVLKSFLKPVLVLIISGIVALVVVGPLGTYAGELLSQMILAIQSKAGWLALAVMTALMPLIVMTGMHWAFAPIFLIASPATPDVLILPAMLAANVAQGAAAFAVAFISKNKETKQVSVAAGISAMVAGVTEPALYGITLKYKKPLYAAMISGAITGVYIGLTSLSSFVFANPSLLSLPQFIGGEGNSNIINAIIVSVASIVITFVLTIIFGIDEEEANTTPQAENIESGSYDPKKVYSPVKGDVVKLEDVNDATFAEKLMGDGIAVYPTDDTFYAPFDGTVSVLFPTKHAIGLVSDAGVELLIHIGINTVELDGEGFEAFIEVGQKVVKGQPLVKVDLEKVSQKGYDLTTPLIVTNTADYIEVVAKDEMLHTTTEDILVYVI